MKNKNKKYFNQTILASLVLAVIFMSLALVFLPQISQAAEGLVPCGTTVNPKPCNLCYLILGFQKLVDYGYKIAFVIALACVTFAGIMYLVSSGDESLMTSAKNFIKASLIGFALIFCAWVIVNTTIYLLQAKIDLGTSNWWSLKCDAGSGGGGAIECPGGSTCQGSCDPTKVVGACSGGVCCASSSATEECAAPAKCQDDPLNDCVGMVDANGKCPGSQVCCKIDLNNSEEPCSTSLGCQPQDLCFDPTTGKCSDGTQVCCRTLKSNTTCPTHNCKAISGGGCVAYGGADPNGIGDCNSNEECCVMPE